MALQSVCVLRPLLYIVIHGRREGGATSARKARPPDTGRAALPMPSSRALARHDRPRKAMVCPTYGALAPLTATVRAVFMEDPPTSTLYSPGITSQLSLSTLKMDRWSGSIARLTVLVSPEASWILSQARSEERRVGK